MVLIGICLKFHIGVGGGNCRQLKVTAAVPGYVYKHRPRKAHDPYRPAPGSGKLRYHNYRLPALTSSCTKRVKARAGEGKKPFPTARCTALPRRSWRPSKSDRARRDEFGYRTGGAAGGRPLTSSLTLHSTASTRASIQS